MKKHTELSDAQFLQQFINCELDPAIFSHEAHLRLAYIHIDRHGLSQAEKNIVAQLKRFTQSLGVSEKYNATLTHAAIKAVYHFMQKSTTDTFEELIHEFPRLKTNFKGLMSCHYGFDIFNSDKAKKTFLAPDLLPFD